MYTSRQFRPGIERLEERTVPSVNVAFSSKGILTITSDNKAHNECIITDDGVGDLIVQYGDPSETTAVATFSHVSTVNAQFGSGGHTVFDYLYSGNLIVPETLNINMGSGFDAVGTVDATQADIVAPLTVNMRVGAQEPGFSASQLFVGLNQVDANTTITLTGSRGSDMLDVYMLSSFNSTTFNVVNPKIGAGVTLAVNELAGTGNTAMAFNFSNYWDAPGYLNGNLRLLEQGGGGHNNMGAIVIASPASGASRAAGNASTITLRGGTGTSYMSYYQNDPTDTVFASLFSAVAGTCADVSIQAGQAPFIGHRVTSPCP
jgi:hypothetical protein